MSFILAIVLCRFARLPQPYCRCSRKPSFLLFRNKCTEKSLFSKEK